MRRFGLKSGPGTGPRRFNRIFLTVSLSSIAVLLSGCSAETVGNWSRAGLPEGVTREASHTQNLWIGSWITAMIVGVVVWGLILGAAFLYRRKRNDRGLPPQVRYNVPIEVLYTVLPFIIVSVLFFFTARDQHTILSLSDNPPHTINVVAKQWSWDFNYASDGLEVYELGTPATPPELVLPRGETVRFLLTSRDVIHSFWVVPFLFKQDVIPGRLNQFEATPEKLGVFRGKCAEFCGQDHARMLFTARIVEPEEYRAYLRSLEAQGKTGSLPADLGETERDSRSGSQSRMELGGRSQ